MRWTSLNFGKHSGRSLPEIIVCDADWFFWAASNSIFQGKLSREAKQLVQNATAIKIPKQHPERWEIEYSYEPTGRFCGFQLVKADAPWHRGHGSVRRLPYLDMSCVGRRGGYDKRGCRNLLRDFRYHYFGRNKRLTKRRCEQFFSDDRNFLGRR